jgi:hypothetical protein
MPVHDDEGRPAEPGRGETDEPGGVGLGEDFDVLALLCSETMQHHAERTMMVVLLDVEQRRGIARPDQLVGGVDDQIGEVVATFDVAHANRHHLGSEFVEAPGEFRVIRRM